MVVLIHFAWLSLKQLEWETLPETSSPESHVYCCTNRSCSVQSSWSHTAFTLGSPHQRGLQWPQWSGLQQLQRTFKDVNISLSIICQWLEGSCLGKLTDVWDKLFLTVLIWSTWRLLLLAFGWFWTASPSFGSITICQSDFTFSHLWCRKKCISILWLSNGLE